jgi:hypothetical protein
MKYILGLDLGAHFGLDVFDFGQCCFRTLFSSAIQNGFITYFDVGEADGDFSGVREVDHLLHGARVHALDLDFGLKHKEKPSISYKMLRQL